MYHEVGNEIIRQLKEINLNLKPNDTWVQTVISGVMGLGGVLLGVMLSSRGKLILEVSNVVFEARSKKDKYGNSAIIADLNSKDIDTMICRVDLRVQSLFATRKQIHAFELVAGKARISLRDTFDTWTGRDYVYIEALDIRDLSLFSGNIVSERLELKKHPKLVLKYKINGGRHRKATIEKLFTLGS